MADLGRSPSSTPAPGPGAPGGVPGAPPVSGANTTLGAVPGGAHAPNAGDLEVFLPPVEDTRQAVEEMMDGMVAKAIVGLDEKFPTELPGLESLKPHLAKKIAQMGSLAGALHNRSQEHDDPATHQAACTALHNLADAYGTGSRWAEADQVRGTAILHARWLDLNLD